MKTLSCIIFLAVIFTWFGCGGSNNDGDGGVDGGTDCGNSIVDSDQGEACDDGNTESDDGCDPSCSLEAGWYCPETGGACIEMICGDGIIDNPEMCDETEMVDGSVVDQETSPICAGGFVLSDPETCEDGNTKAGDGCDDQCHLEPGWDCPTDGTPCTAVRCGDGFRAGDEVCDDGNMEIGDGCTPFCLPEPRCTDGICEAICGDGIKNEAEPCEDGNVEEDDGCSSSCQIEFGFACEIIEEEEPELIQLPVVYRDFRGYDLDPGHPDFENENNSNQGIVETMLDGTPGKPVFIPGSTNTIESTESFNQWYSSVEGVNMTIVDHLPLDRISAGTFLYSNEYFYPLTGQGYNGLDPSDPLFEDTRTDGDGGGEQNFHFTSEVRYWFEYKGTELLEFFGDDDVWVFINGKLTVDIGGVHGARTGSVDLDGDVVVSGYGVDPIPIENFELGLEIGKIYEVVVFQAERHTTRSEYQLTLTNFLTERSVCKSECGDGEKAADEECDDGNLDNDDGCDENCELEGGILE